MERVLIKKAAALSSYVYAKDWLRESRSCHDSETDMYSMQRHLR